MLVSQRQAVRIGTAAGTGERRGGSLIVGRDRELASLRRALATAGRGMRQAVLISGEAGIGKTALMAAFAKEARRARTRVLTAECLSAEAARPFAPFIDVASQLDRTARDAEAVQLVGLAQLRRLTAAEARGQRSAIHESERWQVGTAFVDLFRALSFEDTLVLVIEDVQWADAASRELLLHLARKLKDFPLLVAASYRRAEPEDPALASFIAELTRIAGCAELELGPLDRRATALLVGAALGFDGRPEREFVIDVHRQAEGNPLLTEELLADLIARGVIARRDGAWYREASGGVALAPRSVTQTVGARLEALTVDARSVLRAAAVLGQRFSYDALLRVSHYPFDVVTTGVRSGVDAHLIVADAGTYRFRHALIREAVLATLLEPERRALHAAAARALAGIASDAELAEHFEASGDLEAAARHHIAAGFMAETLFAYSDAIRHAERALEIGTLDPALGDLLLRTMPIAHSAVNPRRGMAFAEQTKAYFDRRGDVANAGHALVWIGGHWARLGEPERQHGAWREALALLEPLGDTKELAIALIGTALATHNEGRSGECVEVATRAIEIARRVGDPWGESFGLATLAWALKVLGRPDEAVLRMRERLAAARRADLISLQMVAVLDDALTFLFDIPGTREERGALLREAIELGRRPDMLSNHTSDLECKVCFDNGDWDGILDLRDEIASFEDESRWSHILRLLGIYVGLMRTGDVADPGEVERLSETIVAKGNWGYPPAFVSAMALTTGDYDRAIIAAEPLLAPQRRFDAYTQAATSVYALFAARLGGDEAAYERWASVARARTDVRSPLGVARRELVFSEDAVRARDLETAIGHLRACIDNWVQYEFPPIEMLLRERLAELLVTVGRRDEAQAEIDLAVSYWRKAKAHWYIDRLAERVKPAGLSAGGATLVRRRSAGLLSRREREVAGLVARGLTNKEIAQQLTLSVRTAESHVEQIRTKLGFRSRAQIASWASRTYGEAS